MEEHKNIKVVLLFFIFVCNLFANTLQEAIDNASAYSTIKLSSGIYIGKITINKPIRILGIKDDVIISGDNIGTVININSSNVVLENLTIINSGNRMDNLDSAIAINKSKNSKIINCKILNSLYGINMAMVEDTIISNNYITSKENEISLKGDALKIWYCNNNTFENNKIENSRDVTLTYSHNNIIKNNIFINNRYGTHISLSHNNLLKNNIYKYNSVALILSGAKDTQVIKNQIKSSRGAAGMGIVAQGGSNLLFKENIISFNTHGFYIDVQDTEQGMQRYIKYNEISYNKEALHFHAAIKNNTIIHNKIFGNIEDVGKDVRGNYTNSNVIEYNYWDRYTGFDRDKDNIGDTTHKNMQYSAQLWHYNKKVKFFYGSPIMSLIDFLASLAPFVKPVLLLEDKKPIINIR